MKLYCEVVVGEVLPSLRALVTKELTERFKLSQVQAAEKLGLTQPAISQYKKFLRGDKVKDLQKNKKVVLLVKEFSRKIADGEISSADAASRLLEISHMIVNKRIVYPEGGIYQKNVPCEICFK